MTTCLVGQSRSDRGQDTRHLVKGHRGRLYAQQHFSMTIEFSPWLSPEFSPAATQIFPSGAMSSVGVAMRHQGKCRRR